MREVPCLFKEKGEVIMTWVKGMAPKFMREMGAKLGQDIGHDGWHWEMDKCWEDYERGYSVCSRMIYTKQWGNVEHVTISRHHKKDGPLVSTGGEAPIGWNEKMMIKNELFGEDRFAIEVYPKQKYLVDVADVYHLWVFGAKYDMPFGIHPKEYKKAINRGATFYEEDMAELQKHMEAKNNDNL